MRQWLRVALLVLVPAAAFAQNGAAPVPPSVRIDGVPAVPAEVFDAIASYGDYRQATLLAWHPTERRVLIETTFGNVPQIHEVRSPGAARTQLTFFRDGVPVGGPAWYGPDGRYVLLRKDIAAGKEDFHFFRYDFETGAVTRITEGVTKAGGAVWSRRSGLIAYDSTRRDGKNRDIWVMDPSNPKTDRLLAETQGIWQVVDWTPDDKELLVRELVSPTEVYLWRINAATGEKTPLTNRGGKPVRWQSQFRHDARLARRSRQRAMGGGHTGGVAGRRVLAVTGWEAAGHRVRSRYGERTADRRRGDRARTGKAAGAGRLLPQPQMAADEHRGGLHSRDVAEFPGCLLRQCREWAR
jgi:hypothetical protein